MSKLRLEEIADRPNKPFLDIELLPLFAVKIGRANEMAYDSLQQTPLQGVYLNHSDSRRTIYVLVESMEGRGKMPLHQGTFQREFGQWEYRNECVYGTLVMSKSSGRILVHEAEPNEGKYNFRIGDTALLGFPRSTHRFQVTLIE